ncbi:TPR repeat-containing protein DDB_G0287407 isoform X2 [Lingula anatina]|uniref:TPR repeat-containing protein DDB_G0287407 isoform X2 n=1 Tax=Lingula anatina TaxID=7574 RepID=A0A1S3H6X6_LINAN|nr:TPR repeat-containing protein DDB_G0287407 isoform X2 [Lingula anatina]|eukprot:XP_013381732.1 TPR repeat-containing protein DDB_G0287407 isoform X2 [Lingula anatina]
MGCGASKSLPVEFDEVSKTWHAVCQSRDFLKPGTKVQVSPEKRTGWKTIRIFVSSTFKDFNAEREVLVKEVFPDLRAWCQERRLHLVECDLRWGVPKNTSDELVLRTCLEEIDRCIKENNMPYFINMTSERVGWIPKTGDVPPNLLDQYCLVFGLSVTEMEIIHGAYKKINPNSIFMLRDSSFLKDLPPDHQKKFLDDTDDLELSRKKLSALKIKITERFPKERVVHYSVNFDGIDDRGKTKLTVDDTFKSRVKEFFKERIDMQYPKGELQEVTQDKYLQARNAHEAFMKEKAEIVLGRDALVQQITEHLENGDVDVPMLILGDPGSGKSSVMARVADTMDEKARKNEIPGVRDKMRWSVFYHFVGAVPGSTDAEQMIRRLLKELDIVKEESQMPKDLEAACQLCMSVLSNTETKPVILVIDALNQLDDDPEALNMTFIPQKLAPYVRCVFSMIPGTPQHKTLISRESKPKEVFVQPLDIAAREQIIDTFFATFNKQLDRIQFSRLMGKKATDNPLWLSIALEELRVYGDFGGVTDKIDSLKEDLLGLLGQVLERFEAETGGSLLVATLCMIEVSKGGLLESELLLLLADEENLMPPEEAEATEKGDKEASEKKQNSTDVLPYFKWASVYRVLRPFLRPYGQSGEGRLDFYHRSLSKAIRQKYFGGQDEKTNDGKVKLWYDWWHGKLADFFMKTDNIERKVEELPFHLIKLGDKERLATVLTDWQVFDMLYHEEWSTALNAYWRNAGGKDQIKYCYIEAVRNDENSPEFNESQMALRYERVARIFVQAGLYDEGQALAEKAIKLEETLLGKRPERMASLCGLMSHVWDQKCKLHEFIMLNQKGETWNTISWGFKSIDYLKPLADASEETKFKMAIEMMRVSFSLSTWITLGGSPQLSPTEARKLGNEYLADAKNVFKSRNDIGKLAEAVMTQAILMGSAKTEQIKLYEEAAKLCVQAYGDKCVLAARLKINTGIYWEEIGNYYKAYEFFRNYALICEEVMGPENPKTIRGWNILNESTYKAIAQELGHNNQPYTEVED